MNILGIDPGTRKMGYAIINLKNSKISLVEAGLIKISQDELQYQIPQMLEAFESIFAKFSIDEVALEDIFYAHNPKTTIKLAQFRGAIMLMLLQQFGQFSEYSALQVKQALTGNGKASKEQVAFMAKRLLGIKVEIKPLDITDAIAIAITHSQRVINK